MNDIYYILTDKVNEGTVIKRTAEGDFKYNIGTGAWESTTMFWDYDGGFDSPYEGLYSEISEADALKQIETNKATWKRLWDVAKRVAHSCYKAIKSPIKGVSYEDYVTLLADYATDERERVAFVLSGLPLTGKNWKSVATQQGIPSNMIDALSDWHSGTKELYRAYNNWVLKAVMLELRYLNNRKDLDNPTKFASRQMQLSNGFSKNEVYAGVKL